MTELVARIDREFHDVLVYAVVDTARYSTPCRALRKRERGVHAVCVPVDELPAHAGDQRREHDTDVGHISGEPTYTPFLSAVYPYQRSTYAGGGHRRVLAVPSVCMLGVPRPVE